MSDAEVLASVGLCVARDGAGWARPRLIGQDGQDPRRVLRACEIDQARRTCFDADFARLREEVDRAGA
jgi:hypothetical protein